MKPRMDLLKALVLLGLIALPACPPGCRECPDNYPNVAFAREKAAAAVTGKYGSCFPPDYDPAAFFTDLKALNVDEDAIKYLRYATADVWTEPDCVGFVYVARCPKDNQIMLWDKSSTYELDGRPGRSDHTPPQTSSLPPRQPPTACACRTQPPASDKQR